MASEKTEFDSAEEFQAALRALLRRGQQNGIDVGGSWACRNGADSPDWEVVVAELEKERPE